MSPETSDVLNVANRFPRVSGDEPAEQIDLINRVAFSPRERG